MRRREFISLVGSALALPASARAEPSATPVIGFLNTASARPFGALVAAFRKGLGEAGFTEGRNVRIEYRWAEGDESKLVALATDLVQRRVRRVAPTRGRGCGVGSDGGQGAGG